MAQNVERQFYINLSLLWVE